jgi:type II secretory pathway pseudopilin PulG
MAVLLVGLGVMAILLTAALPVWRQVSQREKEEDLIFRGLQYARAVGLYQRKYANTSPPSIDVLIEQRFLRSKYKDPMVPDGEFQLLYQTSQAAGSPGARGQGAPAAPTAGASQGAIGRGGIIGVVSKSSQTALRLYRGGAHYNEWQFVYIAQTQQPGTGQGRGTSMGGGAGRGQRQGEPMTPGTGGRGQRSGGAGAGPNPNQSPTTGRPQPLDRLPEQGRPGGSGTSRIPPPQAF